MKITQEESNILKIEEKNLFSVFIGIIFFVGGIIIFFSSVDKKFLIGVISSIIGLLIIVLWRQIKIDLNKNQSKIFILKKGIFTKKEENYNFSDIKEVRLKEWQELQVVTNKSSITNNEIIQNYEVSLITNDGREILISTGGKSRGGLLKGVFAGLKPKTKEQEIAEKISSFLNVPLNHGENKQFFPNFPQQNIPPSNPPGNI